MPDIIDKLTEGSDAKDTLSIYVTINVRGWDLVRVCLFRALHVNIRQRVWLVADRVGYDQAETKVWVEDMPSIRARWFKNPPVLADHQNDTVRRD